MMTVAIQVVLLVLAVIGTVYIIQPTKGRRTACILADIGIITLVVLLGSPQLGSPTESREVATQIDQTDEIFKQTREATAKLQALRADLEGSLGPDRFTGTVVFKRPNLARVEIKGQGELRELLIVSNGRNLFVYFPSDNQYAQSHPGTEGRNIRLFVAEEIEKFFQPAIIGVIAAGSQSTYVGKEMADGMEYDVVEVIAPTPSNKTTRYFISPRDDLIHRVVSTTKTKSGETVTKWIHLKNISTDAPADESTFQWEPPPTAAPLQLPAGITLPFGRDASK
jgi:outer membrane lipoprotein-sorting protein